VVQRALLTRNGTFNVVVVVVVVVDDNDDDIDTDV
jgi:hypothetical protein